MGRVCNTRREEIVWNHLRLSARYYSRHVATQRVRNQSAQVVSIIKLQTHYVV